MKFTILGSGDSYGTPRMICNCDTCTSNDSKNVRRRSSCILEYKDKIFMIDTSPEIKSQIMEFRKTKNKFTKIDGIFYTHLHADHVDGINEIRSINIMMQKRIKCYAAKWFFEEIYKSRSYIFTTPSKEYQKDYGRIPSSALDPVPFDDYSTFFIDDLKIESILQQHGRFNSIGYIFNDMLAYCTDVGMFYDKSLEILKTKKLKILVIGCLRYKPNAAHFCWDDIVKIIKILKPKKTILTHMAHDIKYSELLMKCKELEFDIQPAYDMMTIDTI